MEKGSPVEDLNSEFHFLLHQIHKAKAVVSPSFTGMFWTPHLIRRVSFLPLIPQTPFRTHSPLHSRQMEELQGETDEVHEFSVAWLLGCCLVTYRFESYVESCFGDFSQNPNYHLAWSEIPDACTALGVQASLGSPNAQLLQNYFLRHHSKSSSG